ncbi:MAG TPA: EamA family transporter RarD [Verrucomicrobiales bacterium]|nr:EamA family transporter RarD [Verrucomicrobiales bacterium]
MTSPRSDTARGMAAGITAFTLWGLLPGYWKALGWLSPGQVICLRALLTVPVVAGVMAVRGQLRRLLYSMFMKPRVVGLHVLTAALLAGNWLTFVWATHHGRITEASLGYFLTPLANVAMGALLLGERLSRGQWLALTFAVAGVAIQMVDAGKPPWVALALCVTFAFYGLLRKKASLDSLAGLTVESIVAVPAAFLWLCFNPPERLASGAVEWSLLLMMGAITAIPLLGFATAARMLPLSIVGILQFIAPSLQFIVGAVIYGEPVTMLRMAGFVFIWAGLIVFTMDAWQRSRRPVVTTEVEKPLSPDPE